jgi:multidrug efflux pump subunit AcrA (membrane-fusion protein)
MEIIKLKESETALEIQLKDLREEVKIANEELVAREKRHVSEFEELRAEYDDRIIMNGEKYRAEKEALEKGYNDRISDLSSEIKDTQDNWQNEVAALRAEISALQKERDEAVRLKETFLEGETLRNAKTRALLIEKGVLSEEDSFTDKESFEELEKEYEAFRKFYKSRWKEAKKKIRREILNIDNLKALNGQNEDKE